MTAPQRSPEWFAARKGRVTGSMVGAILGLSPYMTRDDAMRSMVRAALDAPSEFTGNAATEWGTYNEAGAIAEFEMTYGECVEAMSFVPYEDWLGASPDGLVSDGKGIEVKCPYYIRNDVPPIFKSLNEQPHYHAQCQIEMLCCGWKSLWFYQWTPFDAHRTLVHRDDEWLASNLPRLKQFWAEFQDALADPQEHLEPKRKVIDTPDAARMIREYDELSEAIDRATERKTDLLKEITSLAGESNAIFSGRKLTKVQKAGSISYAKAIKAIAPDADLEPYRGKPQSFWQIR